MIIRFRDTVVIVEQFGWS